MKYILNPEQIENSVRKMKYSKFVQRWCSPVFTTAAQEHKFNTERRLLSICALILGDRYCDCGIR